jgi:hypothetical protein
VNIFRAFSSRLRYNHLRVAGLEKAGRGVGESMFGDLGKMMKVAAEMKRRMPEMQARLEQSRFEAEAGGGVVRAVVNGKMRFVDLKIDRSLLADGQTDAAMLEDLIKAALSGAQKQAAAAAAAAMNELTGGMNIPGIDGFL